MPLLSVVEAAFHVAVGFGCLAFGPWNQVVDVAAGGGFIAQLMLALAISNLDRVAEAAAEEATLARNPQHFLRRFEHQAADVRLEKVPGHCPGRQDRSVEQLGDRAQKRVETNNDVDQRPSAALRGCCSPTDQSEKCVSAPLARGALKLIQYWWPSEPFFRLGPFLFEEAVGFTADRFRELGPAHSVPEAFRLPRTFKRLRKRETPSRELLRIRVRTVGVGQLQPPLQGNKQLVVTQCFGEADKHVFITFEEFGRSFVADSQNGIDTGLPNPALIERP
jgi:hypothetical protein